MRKLLFTIVIVLALLLAAEVGVTLLGQRGMERALRSQYELPDSLEVSINSFPYLVSLARNHMREVCLDWRGELQYQVAEGTQDSFPCRGRVNLYDLELNIPALLTGRLEMQRILRQEASLTFTTADLGMALGLDEGSLTVEDGCLYVKGGGEKTQYEVKVAGDDTLVLVPKNASTPGTGSQSYPELGDKGVRFHTLPMDAKLLNASTDGERVYMEISIPSWEGYL